MSSVEIKPTGKIGTVIRVRDRVPSESFLVESTTSSLEKNRRGLREIEIRQ